MTLVLGLDIGGSATRALLDEDGETRASARGASANVAAAGRDEAARVLDGVLHALARTSGAMAPLDAVCVGSAGSGAPDDVEWLVARLEPLVRPGSLDRDGRGRVLAVNDSRLVLAAEGLDSGIALVAGTGSIAFGLCDDREERAGGWGHLLGDEGSGYWIVREALRVLCRRHDDHEPPGALGPVFDPSCEAGAGAGVGGPGGTDLRALVARFHARPAPAEWAGFAPDVLDADDPAAGRIRASAARALAELVREVAGRLNHPDPVPVVVGGGLGARHEGLSAATCEEIAGLVPGARARVATRPPVEGAVRLARQMVEGAPRG